MDSLSSQGDYQEISESTIEEKLLRHKFPLIFFLFSILLILIGVIYVKGGLGGESTEIEVVQATEAPKETGKLVIEVGGAVAKPGVYSLAKGSRVQDALSIAGELAIDADKDWVGLRLNRASKLVDGQKIYIPKVGEQLGIKTASDTGGGIGTQNVSGLATEGIININSVGLNELDSLPGIGPVYAQKIIENRPYSDIGELLTKSVLSKSTFEKIKSHISVY